MNEKTKTPKEKGRHRFVKAAIGLICSLLFVYGFIEKEPKTEKMRSELELEFRLIEPLYGAKIVNIGSSIKPNKAIVAGKYISGKSFEEISIHYGQQLRKNGWTYSGTEYLKDWGVDLGGKSVHYCKDDKAASLQYAGDKANYGWTYAFTLSWGFHECGIKNENNNKKLFIRFGSFFTCISFIVIGSFMLFLPKDKMIRLVFRKESEDDIKDYTAFQVHLILYRFFGIVCITVGSIALRTLFF